MNRRTFIAGFGALGLPMALAADVLLAKPVIETMAQLKGKRIVTNPRPSAR